MHAACWPLRASRQYSAQVTLLLHSCRARKINLPSQTFFKKKTEPLQSHHRFRGSSLKLLRLFGGWLGVTGEISTRFFFRPAELIWTAMPHVQIHSPHGDYQILGTKSSIGKLWEKILHNHLIHMKL